MTASGGVPQFEMRHRMALALESRDISIGEIADYLGVHRNTVGGWLAGRTRPSTASVKLWALRTGVPYSWLTTGTPPDYIPPNTPASECYRGLRPLTRQLVPAA